MFRQAFEAISPQDLGFLVDLRELVMNSKSLWGRSGYISLADDLLPHRSPHTERPEAAKLIDDIRAAFSAYSDSLHRLAAFVGEDEIGFLTEDSACKVGLRSLWQTKRGAADTTGDVLSRLNAQLGEIVRTLKSAKRAEAALKQRDIVANFGSVGMLMDALPYLEKVTNSTTALQGFIDRRLAALIFEEFIDALLEGIEPDVAKAKVAVSKVQLSLQELDEASTRILEASRTESARFADIDSDGITKLVTELIKKSFDSLTSDASIDDVATKLNISVQEISSVEEALARLENAFCELKKLAQEQSAWK